MHKRSFFLIPFLLFFTKSIHSQAILSSNTKTDLKEIISLIQNKLPIPEKYPTLKIQNTQNYPETFISFVGKSTKSEFESLKNKGYWVSGFIAQRNSH